MLDLKRYQETLLKLKEDLHRQIEFMEEGELGESIRESVGALSTIDNHPADMAQTSFERGKDIALRDNLKIILAQVEDALEQIKLGSYGICEICGTLIDESRLEAVPYTTVCKQCREEFDKADYYHRRLTNRPIEELALEHPFGKGFNDDTDKVGFDAEDSWQAVARYGTSNPPHYMSGEDQEAGYVNQDEAYMTDGNEHRGLVTPEDGIIDERWSDLEDSEEVTGMDEIEDWEEREE
ncbi:MAG: TraR/DksA C4-type zinc finger protein [Halanaerobium sp.]|nr:TraR/DksA C4-type zinc finger protein [Halanaerobium sp.]